VHDIWYLDGLNLYEYVKDSPPNYADPKGLSVLLALTKMGGSLRQMAADSAGVGDIAKDAVHCAIIIQSRDEKPYKFVYEIGYSTEGRIKNEENEVKEELYSNISENTKNTSAEYERIKAEAAARMRYVATSTLLYLTGVYDDDIRQAGQTAADAERAKLTTAGPLLTKVQDEAGLRPNVPRRDWDKEIVAGFDGLNEPWVVEVNDDKDCLYMETAENTPMGGEFDLINNNCCHWARRVIEKAGGQWPIPHDINRGVNPGNPPPSYPVLPPFPYSSWSDYEKSMYLTEGDGSFFGDGSEFFFPRISSPS
jgi:hypothetical protein